MAFALLGNRITESECSKILPEPQIKAVCAASPVPTVIQRESFALYVVGSSLSKKAIRFNKPGFLFFFEEHCLQSAIK